MLQKEINLVTASSCGLFLAETIPHQSLIEIRLVVFVQSCWQPIDKGQYITPLLLFPKSFKTDSIGEMLLFLTDHVRCKHPNKCLQFQEIV